MNSLKKLLKLYEKKNKRKIKEKNKLPLIFNHIDFVKNKNLGKIDSNVTYFLENEKYQTDFYVRERPLKHLTRLI